MGPAILLALLGLMFAQGSKKARGTKTDANPATVKLPTEPIRSGSALLEAGKSYSIEITVTGAVVDNPQSRPSVAQGFDNFLRMNGARHVYISPTLPMIVTYDLLARGTTPVVLGVPVTQQIGSQEAQYTFTSVRQIPPIQA